MRTMKIQSPIGELTAMFTDDALCAVQFAGSCGDAGERQICDADAPLTTDDPHRLQERFDVYFAGDARAFEGLSLDAKGTEFRQAVWKTMREIPFGEVISYAEVARRMGRDGAKYGRAVGNASGANPIPVVTPCHRVVGANGSMTGFGGGVETKKKLLRHEGALSGALLGD